MLLVESVKLDFLHKLHLLLPALQEIRRFVFAEKASLRVEKHSSRRWSPLWKGLRGRSRTVVFLFFLVSWHQQQAHPGQRPVEQ